MSCPDLSLITDLQMTFLPLCVCVEEGLAQEISICLYRASNIHVLFMPISTAKDRKLTSLSLFCVCVCVCVCVRARACVCICVRQLCMSVYAVLGRISVCELSCVIACACRRVCLCQHIYECTYVYMCQCLRVC